MGGTFVVTLREGFEAALILGIVYTYLQKIGAGRHYGYATRGGALGVLASVLLGLVVTALSGPLLDFGPDAIALGVIFLAVVVLTWHGYWMQQHARAVKGEVQRRIDEAQATHRLWIIGLIAFTGVFREGAETVLFLWGLLTQATSTSGFASALGAFLGLVAAAALGWAIFRGGQHISLQRFFALTSALLLLLAAGMFSTGIGRLEALGFLPQSSTAWDTSFILDDQGMVGSFLNGLIGYRARPSFIEVAAYVLYLAVAGSLMFRGNVSKPRPTTPEGKVPAHAT
ncbi:MAG TPA: FTR1 family protein [Methylomirabilota bacterium]|nr:FTR1 family protein [Methylomirabilota bacterium]